MRLLPHLLLLSALPAAASAPWPSAPRPAYELQLRTGLRDTRLTDGGPSPAAYLGASPYDQTVAATVQLHEAVGVQADVGRQILLLGSPDGLAVPPTALWSFGAGLQARSDVGPLLATAQLGYGYSQLPAATLGPGTPSVVHGPRVGLGLVAPLPWRLSVRASGTLWLPFASLDGRGRRADGYGSELELSLQRELGVIAGVGVGLRLDGRRRSEGLRGATGFDSHVAATSLGLSVVLSGGTADPS